MRAIRLAVVAALFLFGCQGPEGYTKDSVDRAKPGLSARAQEALDAVRKDSSGFKVCILYLYAPQVGIVLSTSADGDYRFHHAQVDHSEAVRITQHLGLYRQRADRYAGTQSPDRQRHDCDPLGCGYNNRSYGAYSQAIGANSSGGRSADRRDLRFGDCVGEFHT